MNDDAQRKAAGERAAEFVEDGMVIGYGTGRGAAAAFEALARRQVRVCGVPTSQKTIELCRRLGLPIVSLEDHPILDLVSPGQSCPWSSIPSSTATSPTASIFRRTERGCRSPVPSPRLTEEGCGPAATRITG